MQVKELEKNEMAVKMEVVVTAAEIEKEVDAKLVEISKDIKKPGFRPGKVPFNLVKQQYGKAVLGEVLEKVVNETTSKVIEDSKLRPALQPKIEVTEFDEGKDLKFTLALELLPDFKVIDLKSVKVEKPVAKIDKKAVDETLTKIASSNRETEPITEKRPTKSGDIIVMDFHGRTAKDNKPHEGMHAHDAQLDLGSGQFIPGFEDQLIGKNIGDKVEVKVTFPEAYHAPELAGQDAIFDVEVKGISQAKETKIDDDFAKKLGLADEKALRDIVEKQMQGEFDNLSRQKAKRVLLDALDNEHDFPLPAGMVDLEYQSIMQQIRIERQGDVKDGELKLDKDEEEELRAIAERRVRLGLILSEIGRANNIAINDQEMQRAVMAEAQKYPGQEREVFEYYRSNRNALDALRAPVYEDKVVDFILELATVTETPVSVEDLTRVDEDEHYIRKGGKEKEVKAKKKA